MVDIRTPALSTLSIAPPPQRLFAGCDAFIHLAPADVMIDVRDFGRRFFVWDTPLQPLSVVASEISNTNEPELRLSPIRPYSLLRHHWTGGGCLLRAARPNTTSMYILAISSSYGRTAPCGRSSSPRRGLGTDPLVHVILRRSRGHHPSSSALPTAALAAGGGSVGAADTGSPYRITPPGAPWRPRETMPRPAPGQFAGARY